jgi:hypothetical protein
MGNVAFYMEASSLHPIGFKGAYARSQDEVFVLKDDSGKLPDHLAGISPSGQIRRSFGPKSWRSATPGIGI